MNPTDSQFGPGPGEPEKGREAISSDSVEEARNGAAAQHGDDRTAAPSETVGSLARIYAQALFEMAEEQNALDEVAEQVDQLEALLAEQSSLRQLLTTPAIGDDDRQALIQRIFQGRINDVTYRFVQVVNQKGRLPALGSILRGFEQLIEQRRGIVEVDIHVARRLGGEEVEQVSRRIGEVLGKEIVLHQYVEPNLIGGLVIRVGDQLIDGSIATQLSAMRRRLINTGRTRVRQQAILEEETEAPRNNSDSRQAD